MRVQCSGEPGSVGSPGKFGEAFPVSAIVSVEPGLRGPIERGTQSPVWVPTFWVDHRKKEFSSLFVQTHYNGYSLKNGQYCSSGMRSA
jgi:hypothetical protein